MKITLKLYVLQNQSEIWKTLMAAILTIYNSKGIDS